jgi:hypothetical protein
MELSCNWLSEVFCLLPGFPGRYSKTQILLLGAYLILLLNTTVMFLLSLQHLYGIYNLTIVTWLILSIIGLILSGFLSVSYVVMISCNSAPIGNIQMFAVIFDAPRLWLAGSALIFYNHLVVTMLFIYLYTKDYPDYVAQLNQGLSLTGYHGFVESRVIDFLEQCQLSFKLQFVLLSIESIIYPNKNKIKDWMKQQQQRQQVMQRVQQQQQR